MKLKGRENYIAELDSDAEETLRFFSMLVEEEAKRNTSFNQMIRLQDLGVAIEKAISKLKRIKLREAAK